MHLVDSLATDRDQHWISIMTVTSLRPACELLEEFLLIWHVPARAPSVRASACPKRLQISQRVICCLGPFWLLWPSGRIVEARLVIYTAFIYSEARRSATSDWAITGLPCLPHRSQCKVSFKLDRAVGTVSFTRRWRLLGPWLCWPYAHFFALLQPAVYSFPTGGTWPRQALMLRPSRPTIFPSGRNCRS